MEAVKTGTADVDETMPMIEAGKGARKQGEKQGDDFSKSAVFGQSDTVGNGADSETKNAGTPCKTGLPALCSLGRERGLEPPAFRATI